ncbi:MAG: hypothetical protein WD512_20010, partial [Candidatus Paceibacterota bacterium]
MFRFLKYLLVCLVASLLLVAIAWFCFRAELATYTSAKVAKFAISKNIFLNFSQSSFGLINFQSQQLEIEISNQQGPLRLSLQNLKITPVLKSI